MDLKNALHFLDQACTLIPIGEDLFQGQTHPGYLNMVGPFGGVTAAVLLQGVLKHPACIGEPIALTVNFASPVNAGEYQIEARPVKTNRSTQHWIVSMIQAEAVVATATVVIAKRRETWSTHDIPAPRDLPLPELVAPLETDGGMEWVRRYDLKVIHGHIDQFDEVMQDHSESAIWIRDQPPRPIDFLSLTCFCDAFFPRIYVRRRKRVPIGTVSMTIYFHIDQASFAKYGEDFVLGTARANRFRNGFYDQSAEIWSRDGELLASTHQIVYYKE